jgi:hypothetical protein
MSITDDGHILGSHICSHITFMLFDLHNRKDRLEKIQNHYKDEPYEIEIISYEEVNHHAGLQEAFKLNDTLHHGNKTTHIDKAAITLEFSE